MNNDEHYDFRGKIVICISESEYDELISILESYQYNLMGHNTVSNRNGYKENGRINLGFSFTEKTLDWNLKFNQINDINNGDSFQGYNHTNLVYFKDVKEIIDVYNFIRND